jgi:tRNA threonylcarbamoyladenosine biosynthesis protein TsaE
MVIKTNSSKETEEIGRKIGKIIRDRGKATVCLFGDLGTGKTTLIKGIVSSFGISERDMGSASFLIVSEYDTTPPLYHIDLYRLEKGLEDEIGLWEYIESEGITLIEWADRLSELPEKSVLITIKYEKENKREIIIEGIDEEDWNNL